VRWIKGYTGNIRLSQQCRVSSKLSQSRKQSQHLDLSSVLLCCRAAAKLALHDYKGALTDAQASVAVDER
jgi:hypothetical protein